MCKYVTNKNKIKSLKIILHEELKYIFVELCIQIKIVYTEQQVILILVERGYGTNGMYTAHTRRFLKIKFS